jgi:Sec-independent protein translocase protein TatA
VSDLAIVLVVVLVLVLLWRGPKTLPRLGDALGKTIRGVRKEIGDDEPKE